MKDLVLYITKELVSNPDAVSVEESNEDGNVNLVLDVDPKDIGLIIGKSGQTIKAIRKLLIVRAMSENTRVNLRVNEPPRDQAAEAEVSEDQETPNESQASEAD